MFKSFVFLKFSSQSSVVGVYMISHNHIKRLSDNTDLYKKRTLQHHNIENKFIPALKNIRGVEMPWSRTIGARIKCWPDNY